MVQKDDAGGEAERRDGLGMAGAWFAGPHGHRQGPGQRPVAVQRDRAGHGGSSAGDRNRQRGEPGRGPGAGGLPGTDLPGIGVAGCVGHDDGSCRWLGPPAAPLTRESEPAARVRHGTQGRPGAAPG